MADATENISAPLKPSVQGDTTVIKSAEGKRSKVGHTVARPINL